MSEQEIMIWCDELSILDYMATFPAEGKLYTVAYFLDGSFEDIFIASLP